MALLWRRPEFQETAPLIGPMVSIIHPWYRDSRNILLVFPALDPSPLDINTGICGVHCHTILMACGIITNNRFDEVYLSLDIYGQRRVTTPAHGILPHGSYFLQVKGSEPQRPLTDESGTVAEGTPYPIVAGFTDWRFPYGRVPREWRRPRNGSDGGNSVLGDPNVCYLSGDSIPAENAHIIPKEKQNWFEDTNMRAVISSSMDNSSDGAGSIDCQLNMMRLRPDLHTLFNMQMFVIVPKPLTFWPGSCLVPLEQPSLAIATGFPSTANEPQQSSSLVATRSSPAETPELGFAVHFLKRDGVPGHIMKYHSRNVRRKGLQLVSCDCLLARFAWALFPRLKDFLEGNGKRYVLTIPAGKETDANPTETSWMTWDEIQQHRKSKGENSNGVNNKKVKRSHGTMTASEHHGTMMDPNGKTLMREATAEMGTTQLWKRNHADRPQWISGIRRMAGLPLWKRKYARMETSQRWKMAQIFHSRLRA